VRVGIRSSGGRVAVVGSAVGPVVAGWSGGRRVVRWSSGRRPADALFFSKRQTGRQRYAAAGGSLAAAVGRILGRRGTAAPRPCRRKLSRRPVQISPGRPIRRKNPRQAGPG
jgi:hypothetical protein